MSATPTNVTSGCAASPRCIEMHPFHISKNGTLAAMTTCPLHDRCLLFAQTTVTQAGYDTASNTYCDPRLRRLRSPAGPLFAFFDDVKRGDDAKRGNGVGPPKPGDDDTGLLS
jgi:hypothetical protein